MPYPDEKLSCGGSQGTLGNLTLPQSDGSQLPLGPKFLCGPKLGTLLAIRTPDKDPLDTNPVNLLHFSQKEAIIYDKVDVESGCLVCGTAER